MTTMITEIYDAFRDSGASEDQARAAAQVIAAHETRLDKIEARLNILQWFFIVIILFLLVSSVAPYLVI